MSAGQMHGRHDSGELDVFEAARYFSEQHVNRQHLQRRSLDMPTMRPNPHHIMIMDHRHAMDKKQPRSPGGRLATFLNSLFNQSHSKKKKKPKSEDEAPGGGRRKRRSSISHFLSSTDHKKSANTPTKSCKINGKNYKITLLDELHAERMGNGGNLEKTSNFNKLREEDEGGDSDSSSDLFDLPNHDLHFLSSGLPVYGTTHMDRITHF